ncbi:MAG: hypothetical protein DRP29_01680 [Thermodesulfobacteriota bacterium]|nr:MAG: hypothetical protein DRP29_01680 [Thermodesulfobacteriota bacterium]
MDKKYLDKIANFYTEEDFDYILLYYGLKIFERQRKGNIFLELGCSLGISTFFLLDYASKLDVVEGSEVNIKRAKARIGNTNKVKFYHSLWQDFTYPHHKYSDIIWFRGIEHVPDPKEVLKKIKGSLIPEGRLHITFPNALSLHRRLGTLMGIIKTPWSFSERDVALGHFKIYDRFQLFSLLKDSGYKIINWEGIILKPFPNSKMMELYKENPKLIDALFKIGKELPDYCAEIYICAIPKEEEK